MPLYYEQRYRKWLMKEVGMIQGMDEKAGKLACTSLYGMKFYYEIKGKTLPYREHWMWKAKDYADRNVDQCCRRGSYNEVADGRAFIYNMDIDIPFAVEEPWVYNLTRRMIKTFCHCVGEEVDISTVQVIICTTLDDDYNMCPYKETFEQCPYCKGEVLPETREINVISCRSCKTKWSYMPTEDGNEEIYVSEYGATADQDVSNPHKIPTRKVKTKTGIHLIFANAVVSLAQAQQLMAAMLQEAMVFDKTISVAEWYEIIDQAPLHRRDETKPIGLREVFSSKGDRCKCCRGKGKVVDFRDSSEQADCTECYGAGRIDKGKRYLPLDIFYLCTIEPDCEPWNNDSLLQMAEKQEEELLQQDYWPESIPRTMFDSNNLAARATDTREQRLKQKRQKAMQKRRKEKLLKGKRLLPTDFDPDDDSAEARAASKGALVEDDIMAVEDDNWDGERHARQKRREQELKLRRMATATDVESSRPRKKSSFEHDREEILGDDYCLDRKFGRDRISHPRELWPKVKDRSSKTGYRDSTPLDELARIRPQTALDYFYCLRLCSIAYVMGTWRCEIALQIPKHFPQDIFEYGQASKKTNTRKDNMVRKLMQMDPSKVTRNQFMQAQNTRKYAEVNSQLHGAMLDVVAGVNSVYTRCRVDKAYYVNNNTIVCYLDGPNSNYCMNKCALHHSSRAKVTFSSTQGIKIACTSIKTQFGCAKWSGTPWRQMDSNYRNTLFGNREDGPSHKYNWPMLVETYPYLQNKFSGKENLPKLKKYMEWVKTAVFLLNSFNRCSYTKSIKIYTVKQFLWQMNANHNLFVEDLADWGELVEVRQLVSENKSLATRITRPGRRRKPADSKLPVSELGTPPKTRSTGSRKRSGRVKNYPIWRPKQMLEEVETVPEPEPSIGPDMSSISPALNRGLKEVEKAIEDREALKFTQIGEENTQTETEHIKTPTKGRRIRRRRRKSKRTDE